jgi:hypothetical protein
MELEKIPLLGKYQQTGNRIPVAVAKSEVDFLNSISLENHQIIKRIANSTDCFGPEISMAEHDLIRELHDNQKQSVIGKKAFIFLGDENVRRRIDERFYEGSSACCCTSLASGGLSSLLCYVQGFKVVSSSKMLWILFGCIPGSSCLLCSGSLCCGCAYTWYHSERVTL